MALDFRTSMSDPRVIASYWITEPNSHGHWWRQVAETFSEFARELGLV